MVFCLATLMCRSDRNSVRLEELQSGAQILNAALWMLW